MKILDKHVGDAIKFLHWIEIGLDDLTSPSTQEYIYTEKFASKYCGLTF